MIALRRQIALVALALTAFTAPAVAQPAVQIEDVAGDDSGLPPFLRAMKRQDVSVQVYVKDGAERTPAPAGLQTSITILAQGSKVKDHFSTTGEGGVAQFKGIPTNPEVQQFITYKVQVDYKGVRFPFTTRSLPSGEGGMLEVDVSAVTDDVSTLILRHAFVEIRALEDVLLVSHRMSLINTGDTAVNLGNLPAGGLRLTVPEGAKHPEAHDPNSGGKPNPRMLEVLGTSAWFKGTVMPGEEGAADINLIYTIPYTSSDTFEWSMTAPIPTAGGYVLVWRDKWQTSKARQRAEVPLTIEARGIGEVNPRLMGNGKRFWELSAREAMIPAGQPFKFAIGGVPTEGAFNRNLMLGAIGVIFLALVFGFQRPKELGDTTRLSKAHLETERDRLLRALARMRKAAQKGRITQARFEREQEAITARLVSLYKTLDRLEGR